MANEYRQKAAPITRSLVLLNVLDTDDDDVYEQAGGSISLRKSQTLHSDLGSSEDLAKGSNSLPLGASLKELRAWLHVRCEEERSRADWTSELPRNQEDHTVEYEELKNGLNIDVLDRIQRRYGPRPSKFEDLLWPLRLNDGAPRFFRKPIIETRQEMEKSLRNWNRHVGVPVEDTEAREVLINAMYIRVEFLDGSLSYRRSADAHDITSRKLLHAIYAYRLETVHFSTIDTCDLMTIILAHLGYAIPDVDEELKYLMFYTLVTERQYLAHTANATTTRKLKKQIMEAKRMRDSEAVNKHEQQMKSWGLAIWQNNCDTIADRVKIARRNVELKALEELQELTILQTAQKLVLQERISHGAPPSETLIPRSTWLPEHSVACDTALTVLNKSAHEHISESFASLKISSQNIADMEDTSRARILTRAIKFAGLDLPKDLPELKRLRIVKARMVHPGTMNMIADAVEAITETKVKGKEMIEAIGKIDHKFEEVLKAVEVVKREYGELLRLVEGDPMMEPEVNVNRPLNT